ncbi:S-methyl-5-thioribose-1-phosphate isomerase [candidate division FCPU426 bacterium]|nr:S-methyl-5-thioribose-1-phosphate isomerase [candidate division FCPU426 bacterium]
MQKAIEWKQHRLFIVDQTKLPNKIVKLQCRNPRQIVECLKDRKIHGSGALAAVTAFSVFLAVKTPPLAKTYEKLVMQIEKTSAMLLHAQPTSMSVAWALDRMRRCARNNRDHKMVTLRDILQREALTILKEEEKSTEIVAKLGADLIRDGDTILTYGNTGSFSSAGRGTALGMIIEAARCRQDIHVLVCETRPGLHGARQTAMELKQAKVPFQIITDNMIGHLMKKGMVDIVVAGADRIAMNGDTAAEIGTYGLAVMAYHHNVSFYVAATVAAFDRNIFSGELIPIEERQSLEILPQNGRPVKVPGLKALYPAFDITPQKYISAIISELGVIRAPYDQNLRNVFSNLG